MNLALILTGLSIALLNFGPASQISAILFSLLSLSMMAYSLYRYLNRIDKLQRRAEGREKGGQGLDYCDTYGVGFLLVRTKGFNEQVFVVGVMTAGLVLRLV